MHACCRRTSAEKQPAAWVRGLQGALTLAAGADGPPAEGSLRMRWSRGSQVHLSPAYLLQMDRLQRENEQLLGSLRHEQERQAAAEARLGQLRQHWQAMIQDRARLLQELQMLRMVQQPLGAACCAEVGLASGDKGCLCPHQTAEG